MRWVSRRFGTGWRFPDRFQNQLRRGLRDLRPKLFSPPGLPKSLQHPDLEPNAYGYRPGKSAQDDYADDFVILSGGKAKEAREWTGSVVERLGLTLNEKKTSIRNARQERFDFLGYTFGPHINPCDGHRYIGYSPSQKSVSRIKQKVGELLDCRNGAAWEEVRQKLNGKLQGWRQYFHVGSTGRAVDEYVYDRVRNLLRRRHKVSSQGIRQFPAERVYGTLGVVRLRGPWVARP